MPPKNSHGRQAPTETATSRPLEPQAGTPDEEFQLLEEMAHTILDAARALKTALDGAAPTDEAWQTIRDLEHKGDAVARDLFEALMVPRALAVEADVGFISP